jgi:hypothetical protein
MWLKVSHEGTEELMAYTFVDLMPLSFGKDSSFQNTAEYMASLFCVHGMILMGVAGEPCLHRGDSISALTWTQKGTVRSEIAMKPALLFAMYVMFFNIDVVGTVHLPHGDNTRMDIVSRRGSWEEVWREDQLSYDGSLPREARFLDLQCDALAELLNPLSTVDTDTTFMEFFNTCLSHCQALQNVANVGTYSATSF